MNTFKTFIFYFLQFKLLLNLDTKQRNIKSILRWNKSFFLQNIFNEQEVLHHTKKLENTLKYFFF